MRKKYRQQMSLMSNAVSHPRAMELERMSEILDKNPIISELALQDLGRSVKNPDKGAKGMTAEQVVRSAVIKQTEEFSYRQLAFHIMDSNCYRRFCRLGVADKGFKKATLCSNIKALSAETWEAIHRVIVGYGKEAKIEKGREVRIDCSVVSSNIHDPSDSSLLWDSVRVITHIINQASNKLEEIDVRFPDHRRRAKRRMLGVMNAKSKGGRKKQYKDLVKISRKTVGYAQELISILDSFCFADVMEAVMAKGIAEELAHYTGLAQSVIKQTERRVVHGEKVPSLEKVVSIFEPHTDIIVKDRRDVSYGHKICLTSGKSNLITDCVILEGNPADSTLTQEMLDRQKELYGRYPLKAALDGGFATKTNLNKAKSNGIKDVCFAKRRGLDIQDMCRSEWVYKRLRKFRAGIESGISWLKRCFGLSRCIWKGMESFKSYVWASIVSANLVTLARKELA